MNTARSAIAADDAGIALRWMACLLVVIAAHMAAFLLLRTSLSDHGTPAEAPAVLLDLAPEPQAPPAPAPLPEPVPPAPAPPEALTPPQPEPLPPIEQQPPEPPPMEVPVAPIPQPEAVLPVPPPPRPPARAVKRPPAEKAPPPVSSPPAQVPQAAPAPVQAAPQPGAMPTTWQGALRAHLARFKRYPMLAQRRGEEGTALVRFTMNRAGTVLSVALVRGSGHGDLDEEAQHWIERAQPLPPPPPEVARETIEVVIPLKFELH